jgi:hypothetical protein
VTCENYFSFLRRETREQGREERETERRKEKRKKEPFCFSPFLSSGFLCFLPRQTSAIFSLFHCETLRLAARKVSSLCSMSLDISPGPVPRQYPSPNSKGITLDAASCRCSRGEKRTEEDALLGASIFGQWRRTTSRSQYPATGLLSSQKFVSRP